MAPPLTVTDTEAQAPSAGVRGTVSLVMATFRRTHCIGETVRQLLEAQTRTPLELIVVNNDPAPDAEAAIRAVLPVDSRVRISTCTEGRQGACRNHGLSLATGDYVAFVDDDDDHSAEYIARLAEALDAGVRSVRCQIQTCGCAGPDCNGKPTRAHHPLTPNTMARRDVLTATWNDPPSEDRDYWSRHPVETEIDDCLVITCHGPGQHSPRNAAEGGSWRVRFVITMLVTGSDARFLKASLASLLAQTYRHFACLLLDQSGDARIAAALAKAASDDHRFAVARPTTPCVDALLRATANSVQQLAADDVLMVLHANERLAHSAVLNRLAHVYAEQDEVWMTFGACVTEPLTPAWPQASFPPRSWETRRFRAVPTLIGEYAPFTLRAQFVEALQGGLTGSDTAPPNGGTVDADENDLALFLSALEAAGVAHAYQMAEVQVIKSLDKPQFRDAARRRAALTQQFEIRARPAIAPLTHLREDTGDVPDSPRSAEIVVRGSVEIERAREPVAVDWEGPVFTHSSLGLVNREMSVALVARGIDLRLLPSQADDFQPSPDSPLAEVARRMTVAPGRQAAVHVAHQWPPQLTAPDDGVWVLMQPWEYGGLPGAWIPTIRDQVDEFWVYCNWQRECAIQSGIPAGKVVVVPIGIDPVRYNPAGDRFPLRTKKRTKLLAVGGIIPRKGMDLLVETYLRTFTAADDVCLVIKGLSARWAYNGNPGQRDFAKLPALAHAKGAAEIEFIGDTLDDDGVASLYRACDALVAPFRGEGFGLPITEAMATGLPVVVTEAGPVFDICDGDTAYLIPAGQSTPDPRIVGLEPGRLGFWWADPDVQALGRLMRHVVQHPDEARLVGARGRERVLQHFTFATGAAIADARLRVLATRIPLRHVPAAVFGPNVSPFPLDQPRHVVFLHQPSWRAESWKHVVRAYLRGFRQEHDVSLVITLDPVQGFSSERVVQVLAALRAEVGCSEADGPDILLVTDDLDDATLASLVQAAGCVVVTAADVAGRSRAKAVGKPVLDDFSVESWHAAANAIASDAWQQLRVLSNA